MAPFGTEQELISAKENHMIIFIIGFVAGAVVIALTPPEYEDRLRLWIINNWQKVTKKG